MFKTLYIALILLPAFLVVAVPQLAFIGPLLLAIAFVIFTAMFYLATFKRHRAGPLALYVQPTKYLGMRFSDGELKIFKICMYAAVGGILGIGAVVVR